MLATLSDLVERSLVHFEPGDPPRWRLQETVRQYARERLAKAGEEVELLRRHARFYAGLVQDASAADPETAIGRIRGEHDNVLAALGWAAVDAPSLASGLRMAGDLQLFWYLSGRCAEGRACAETLLRTAGVQAPSPERVRALNTAAMMAWRQGDYAAAGVWLEEAHVLASALGESALVRSVLCNLGAVAAETGNWDQARGWFEQALALTRPGDRAERATLLTNLSQIALTLEQDSQALPLLEEATGLARQEGADHVLAAALTNLGILARRAQDWEQARAVFAESLEVCARLGHERGIAEVLEEWARTLLDQGRPAPAARLLAAAGSLRAEIGAPLEPYALPEHAECVERARGSLGTRAFEDRWREGSAKGWKAALADLLPGSSPR